MSPQAEVLVHVAAIAGAAKANAQIAANPLSFISLPFVSIKTAGFPGVKRMMRWTHAPWEPPAQGEMHQFDHLPAHALVFLC
jgi:hypothetical protein